MNIKLKKGLDIKLLGKAENVLESSGAISKIAIKPTDFEGLTPKLAVKLDDKVKAGSPLFFDKYNPDVIFTSPVSGTVVDINRGERRRILEVTVKSDAQITHEDFGAGSPSKMSSDEIKSKMLKAGVWPFVRQRPYAIIAKPQDSPKAIFVSAFDSAPLAPDYDFILENQKEAFQTGLDVLAKLTTGAVHLNIHETKTKSAVFTQASGVQKNTFSGPHPSGSIGVQIHHIAPINKGEVVWYVNPQDVAIIGRLFLTGKFDASRVVALTGSELKAPKYYKTFVGAELKPLLKDGVEAGNLRYISGNVLTGTQINPNNYIGFYENQVTVIPEGDQAEFLGWGTPGFGKFSISRTFFSWLTPNKEFRLDSNMRGGERPFVVSGEYEKVVPMDIYPVQLLKAILVQDIDRMEQLGIYEVTEEDFALCEVICTSKVEVQKILREGLNMMIKEFS